MFQEAKSCSTSRSHGEVCPEVSESGSITRGLIFCACACGIEYFMSLFSLNIISGLRRTVDLIRGCHLNIMG